MDSQTFNIELPSLPAQSSPLQYQQQPDSIRKSTEMNNLFNKLIAYNYSSKFISNSDPEIDDDLIKFFQILLWSEKKCPELVIQLFEMMAVQQIQQIHMAACMGIFLKGYILMLGNCKQGGVLAQLLLDHKLPHTFLTAYLTKDKTKSTNNNNNINNNKDTLPINKQQQDQKITYIGSFLKSYHRIFRNQWLNKFIINQQYFQLLEISMKFYNCPQPLTRTTVFNVVLDLLNYQNVQEYLNYDIYNNSNSNAKNKSESYSRRKQFYSSIAEGMVRKFRKQLYVQGERILKIENEGDINNQYDEIIKQIDDKISEWEDISRICSKIPQLFNTAFTNYLLLPLLISPIKPTTATNKPMFTIKYSLLILKKLIKTVNNFGLMDVILGLMFVNDDVIYYAEQIVSNREEVEGAFSVGMLIDMQLEMEMVREVEMKEIQELEKQKQKQKQKQILLDKQVNNQFVINGQHEMQLQSNKVNFGAGIKKFFQNILKTKDNYFLLSITMFFSSLYQTLLQSQPDLLQKYNLRPNQLIHTQICDKLITQLSQNHRLITIQSILNTVIIINQQKFFQSDSNLSSQLLYIFKNVIDETKISLKTKSQLWDFIVQINQYDLMRVNQVKLGKSYDSTNNTNKREEIYKVIFMRDVKNQQNMFLPFYSCIPQTSVEQFRYVYSKYLLMRKAMAYLIEGLELSNLASDYYSKFILNPPYNPGETLTLNQLKQQFQQCQIIDGKFSIPALWIVNQDFLILAHHDKQKKQIKIILTIKYKHISTELKSKKDKFLTSFSVKIYDYKTQKLKYRNSISVKGIESLMFRFIGFQIRVKQKEMVFIQNHVKKTEQSLPKVSLI